MSRCEHCSRPLTARQKRWCCERCRGRGRRRIAHEQHADSYPAGARRGRTPMGRLTREERLRDEIRLELTIEEMAARLRRAKDELGEAELQKRLIFDRKRRTA